MEENNYEGTINQYLETQGNNKPWCLVYEEEDEMNEIKEHLDFTQIQTTDLTLRLTGKKQYSIQLPETLSRLTIEMLSDTIEPLFPKLITTNSPEFYDLTLSSINSSKPIVCSIPSSVTSVSFMSCNNITIKQDHI